MTSHSRGDSLWETLEFPMLRKHSNAFRVPLRLSIKRLNEKVAAAFRFRATSYGAFVAVFPSVLAQCTDSSWCCCCGQTQNPRSILLTNCTSPVSVRAKATRRLTYKLKKIMKVCVPLLFVAESHLPLECNDVSQLWTL